MPHPQILRAESFLHAAVFGPVPIEVLFPKRDRSVRNGVAGARQLARPGAPRLPRVRKTRRDRTDVGVGIAVVEVIDGDVSIHQDGLLDQPLPEYLGKEVDILLRAAGAQRDVVNALHEACHGLLQTAIDNANYALAATLACSSARTNPAPRTMADSFAKATSRVQVLHAAIRRHNEPLGRDVRQRAANSIGNHLGRLDVARRQIKNPEQNGLAAEVSEHGTIQRGLRRFD